MASNNLFQFVITAYEIFKTHKQKPPLNYFVRGVFYNNLRLKKTHLNSNNWVKKSSYIDLFPAS